MKNYKYAVYPGMITSITDGDRHYITARQLIRLYGVDEKECFIVKHDDGAGIPPNLIALKPRYDGNYTL